MDPHSPKPVTSVRARLAEAAVPSVWEKSSFRGSLSGFEAGGGSFFSAPPILPSRRLVGRRRLLPTTSLSPLPPPGLRFRSGLRPRPKTRRKGRDRWPPVHECSPLRVLSLRYQKATRSSRGIFLWARNSAGEAFLPAAAAVRSRTHSLSVCGSDTTGGDKLRCPCSQLADRLSPSHTRLVRHRSKERFPWRS